MPSSIDRPASRATRPAAAAGASRQQVTPVAKAVAVAPSAIPQPPAGAEPGVAAKAARIVKATDSAGQAPKPTLKPTPKPKPKRTPTQTAKTATGRQAAEPAAKQAPARASAPVAEPKPSKKPSKLRPKMVRDSFTMPDVDFDLIAALKFRGLTLSRSIKKSELLRAGLQVLAALDDRALLTTLDKLAPVKMGRPKKGSAPA